MNKIESLEGVKRVGIGLAFILFPLVFVFAFATHPDLLNPHLLGPEELIQRARGEGLLHLGHALVTLNTALLVVIAVHFMRLLGNTSAAWAGFVGGVVAVLGALMLAADKGALCLTMSALDGLPEDDFAQMMPGLLAIFSKGGWLILIWGILLLPVGFAVQAIALIKTRTIARWQGILFLIGVLFVGVPDGVEIINLTASLMLTAACVPYGFSIIGGESQSRIRQRETTPLDVSGLTW